MATLLYGTCNNCPIDASLPSRVIIISEMLIIILGRQFSGQLTFKTKVLKQRSYDKILIIMNLYTLFLQQKSRS